MNGPVAWKSRASILIVCVWALVFFTFLGTTFYAILDGRMRTARFQRDRLLAEQAAWSACRMAQEELRTRQSGFDTLRFCRGERAGELGQVGFTYTLADEMGKLNVNLASAAMLAKLPGLNTELGQRIASPEARPFTLKEELAAVEGIGGKEYDAIRGLVTVYGDGTVNVNTAPEEVLNACGVEPSVTRKIIMFRNGRDGMPGTGDDGAFSDAREIATILEANAGLTQAERLGLGLLVNQGKLCASSDVFTVLVKVNSMGRDIGRYEIVLDRDSILQWQEW